MPSSSTSNFQHQTYLDFWLKGTAWTPPSTFYVALFTTSPSLAGTGGVEVSSSGTGYSRITISRAGGSWNGPSGTNQEYSNAADLTFGSPTGNWGTIVAAAIYDASSGGNMLLLAPFTTAKTVNNGDAAPKILAGQLKIARATC